MIEWKEYKLRNLLVDKGYVRGPFGSSLRRNEMKNETIANKQKAISKIQEV